MAKMNRHCIIIACCLLAACASSKKTGVSATAGTEVDTHILAAATRIQAAQVRLHKAGAFDRPSSQPEAALKGGQRISVEWVGDAGQLLSNLAKSRGWTYKHSGVRLPLPVHIVARDEPFEAVIDQVRSQIGYRASVEQDQQQLILSYHPPR